jgi:hypothetical protein
MAGLVPAIHAPGLPDHPPSFVFMGPRDEPGDDVFEK